MALTDKQEMFCREYLINLNAAHAVIKAASWAKTAFAASNLACSNNLTLQVDLDFFTVNRNRFCRSNFNRH